MHKVFSENDLGIPYTNGFNRLVVNGIKKMLGLDRLNELYNASYCENGVDFAAKVLDNLSLSYEVRGGLENIPAQGAFVAIANHPHGALDGLLLADLIVRRRPDSKFMGNFLLERVEPMRDMFLKVNPFDARARRNISGVRAALEHLKNGGGLILFPAGEVSTYYNNLTHCEDKPWAESMMRFIKNAGVEVLPIYISGTNSRKFHFYGKIHPSLRTVRLPLELLNKSNKKINIRIGAPVSKHRQKYLPDLQQYSNYLRANVYYLEEIPEVNPSATKAMSGDQAIAKGCAKGVLAAEIASLAQKCKIMSVGTMELYLCDYGDIPHIMNEIARLREYTFRNIGEGTGRSEDRDEFDKSYRHLFIWESHKQEIVGAYRLGMGREILQRSGIEGFYSYTLFEYSSKFRTILENCIELGRTFIVPEYQRQNKPLMLLWQGILQILTANSDYRYLLGSVTMSNSYSTKAKVLMVNYFKEHHWDKTLAKMVVPRNGIGALAKVKINTALLKNIDDIALIDKLIIDLDSNNMAMPVLFKKYLSQGSKFIGFNVDHDFNDCLDGLAILDVRNIPMDTIKMLEKR